MPYQDKYQYGLFVKRWRSGYVSNNSGYRSKQLGQAAIKAVTGTGSDSQRLRQARRDRAINSKKARAARKKNN